MTEYEDAATFRLPGRWQVGLFAFVMLLSCAKALVDLHFGMLSLSFVLIEKTALALLLIFVCGFPQCDFVRTASKFRVSGGFLGPR